MPLWARAMAPTTRQRIHLPDVCELAPLKRKRVAKPKTHKAVARTKKLKPVVVVRTAASVRAPTPNKARPTNTKA